AAAHAGLSLTLQAQSHSVFDPRGDLHRDFPLHAAAAAPAARSAGVTHHLPRAPALGAGCDLRKRPESGAAGVAHLSGAVADVALLRGTPLFRAGPEADRTGPLPFDGDPLFGAPPRLLP